MRFRTPVRKRVFINLTPLIDTLFLLLIFIVLTSRFVEQPGIKVHLPHAGTSQVLRSGDVVVYIDLRGGIYLGGKKLDQAMLQSALAEKKNDDAQLVLVVRADRQAPYGQVVAVLDAARAVGIERVVSHTSFHETKR